ncbi:GL27218 [Drosophila persimilis]|uniref:GL27218 n=1 Tax=Drosophila persimilis TaxID=7234 RepID=B4GYX6_DROPE|nr:uncharacterized protein LOC6598757 [Drosophila persimilis]EDW27994.1 GL27218 [Drosophila persimilis]
MPPQGTSTTPFWLLASFLGLLLLLQLPHQTPAQCIDNHEPGCQHPAEIGMAQRHCIDPTKFWQCYALGNPAKLKYCRPNMAFDQDRNACVPWIAWVWQPCLEPVSRPPGWEVCQWTK